MTFNTQIRLFQLFVQVMGVYAAYYIIATSDFFWVWVVIVCYIIIGPISIGLTLHRLLTHRTFTTYKWVECILSFLTVYCTLGPSISWVGLHRFHHSNADTLTDPHSPHNGIIKAWTGYGWIIPQIPLRYVKDLMKVKLHKFMLAHYFKILFTTIFILAVINPVLPLFVYFLPSALAFHGVNMINVLGHLHGYRNFNTPDKSTNSWITHIVTWEGLHNNHHACPTRSNHRVQWWEFDPLNLIIRVIETDDRLS